MPTATSTRLRGVLSAVLLLAATIGLPLALAETVGNPLHSWPSLRAGQLSDTDMVSILAAIFWIAWLSFAVPALLEIVLAVRTRITHHPIREIRIPMLGSQQDLARSLISAVLLLLPAQTATGTAVSAHVHAVPTIRVTETAWTTPSVARPNHHTNRPSARVQEHERSYVIPETGGMRSYWALAEHYLGDGARWRDIWHLNQGRTHADGTVMDSPRQLHAGWTILIPSADDPHNADPQNVSPGPPKSRDVAVEPGDTLSGIAADHGIGDWRQMWEANADRSEPNGQRFTDPNLIDPGWTLTVPNTKHPDHDRPHNGDAHSGAPHKRQQPRPDPTPSSRGGHSEATPPESTSPTPSATPTQAGTSQTPKTAPPTATDKASPPTSTTTDREEHHHSPIVPLGIGLGAAAALAVLDRARRVAQRRRRIGYRTAPPPPSLRRVEAELRHDAEHTHSTASAVELALHLAAPAPVTIRAVIARSDGAVDLRLTEEGAAPIPPFHPVTGGWRLPADAAQFGFAIEDCDDPHPLFAPIGTTSDGQILLDLAADLITLTGTESDVRAYLTHLTTAIAGAPWAMRVQLHVPPWLAADAGPLDRISEDDATCPRPPASASTAPGLTAEEPGWRTAPIYLYCGWSADDHLEPLLTAAATPGSNVHAIVRAGEKDASAQTWHLDGNRLHVPGIIEPITVAAPRPNAAATVELIEHARAARDLPVGHLELPEHHADAPPSPPHVPARDTLPIASAQTIHDGETPAPPLDTTTLRESEQPRRLLLLGPVELTGTGKLRRAQVLNVLTFLALHRRGVSRDQFIDAMWPKQAPSGQTVRNRLVDSRALVDGAVSEGPPWRLEESVTTDWQEFIALAAGTPDQQRQALQLIRGRPFEGLDDAPWLHLEGFRSEVEAAIVDLALTVAERDLDTGNYPGALAAARKGLLASRYEERLHRAGIRAALAQGLDGIADTLETEMRVALDLDIEPDDSVQPETLALIRARRERRSPKSTSSRL